MAEKTLEEALLAVQKELKNPKNDKTNPHFKNSYVSLTALYDVVKPVLTEQGLRLSHGAVYDTESSGWLWITRVSMGEEHTTISLPWTPLDDPQKSGSAMTYAKRQGICALFALAGEDDDDGEAAAQPPQRQEKPAEKPTGGITEPQQKMIRALAENMAIPPTGFNTLKEGWNVQHITEMSKAKASAAITELLEMFLNKVLKLAEQLRIERDELDIMFDRHGLDLTKLDGKALKGVYDELGEIAREVEK